MTLQDGTPRETYREPRNAQGDRPRPLMNTSIVSTIVVLLFLIVGMFAAFYLSNNQVTNAPANTPTSAQQPSATPPR
jgi:ABC-type glycerol-3-phosphate transport system permease component